MGQIERQKVIDTVKNTRKFCDTDNIDDLYDLLIEAFEVLPSAEPEIVHCRDCKHHGTYCYSHMIGRMFDDDFYSRAEIRGDENVHP